LSHIYIITANVTLPECATFSSNFREAIVVAMFFRIKEILFSELAISGYLFKTINISFSKFLGAFILDGNCKIAGTVSVLQCTTIDASSGSKCE